MAHDGYFHPRSMAYRAMSSRAVAISYGQRALTIGALHPRLFIGTTQQTTHRATPYTRLGLTARLFEAVFLGTKDEADRALRFTAKRHAVVQGLTDTDGGPAHPMGSPFSASDPELMWWTAAFTLDSVETMYDVLVRRLSDAEREDLFEGFVQWACLFGMDASAAPSSYADFRERMETFLASDEPFLTDEARLVGHYISGYNTPNPQPWPVRPGFVALTNVVVGSMSERVRELYEFPWTAADEVTYQAVTRATRLAHLRVPVIGGNPLLRGRTEGFFKQAQAAEKLNLKRGRASMPGVSDTPRSA